jgi:ribosomal protein S18 acetylase RimI-like enzyme
MVERWKFMPKARGMLLADPFWKALPIQRVFFLPATERDVFVDRMENPRALMTVSRFTPRIVSIVGRDKEPIQALVDSLGREEYRFHALGRVAADVVRMRFDVSSDNPSWFYTLERKDFVGDVTNEVSPLVPEDAETMNEYWNPDEDSAGYIRSRIHSGLAFGIRVDGRLVAWDATHLETESAVMLGFLHVIEGFRKRGYARSITTTMVNAVFGRGKTPICHVFSDNEPSIRLTEEMGFRRMGEQVWLRTTAP